MFGRKSNELQVTGEPLDELAAALAATSLETERVGDSLIVTQPGFTTRVDVVRPASRGSDGSQVKFVLQIRSELSVEMASLIEAPEAAAAMNSMATLGALTHDDGSVFVGSRLTVYEGEKAWNVQFPLVLHSVLEGANSMLGAVSCVVSGNRFKRPASAWRKRDFELVRTYLSRVCYCETSEFELTATFGLPQRAVDAASEDLDSALWELKSNQPHPEAGGGLLCLLQLPHEISDAARLNRLIAQLNQMEMVPDDRPPHFGAWCRGQLGNNPAYVSFLSNSLHSVPGIAVNMSFWAAGRAQWAKGVLSTMGVRG